MKKHLISVLLVIAGFAPGFCRADLTAVELFFDISDTTRYFSPGSTRGWWFRADQDVLVTQLGFFDAFDDGLAEAHDVGLWTESGVLLGSAQVPAGTAAPLTNNFRYVDVAPISLSAGENYVIAALMTSNDAYIEPGQPNQGPSHHETHPYFHFHGVTTTLGNPSGVLEFPHALYNNGLGSFGPNFTFIVPEPDLAIFVAIVLTGLLARRHQNRMEALSSPCSPGVPSPLTGSRSRDRRSRIRGL